MRRPERLPREVKQLLARFFPEGDLDRICVYEEIPWYVMGEPVGYADRHNVYLARGFYRIDSVEGLALLAHEITHCRQYFKYGAWRFRMLYLVAYFKNRLRGMSRREAYLNIPFEVEARRIEAEVHRALSRLPSRQSADFFQSAD
jgi:hypothetical protein